MRISVDYVCVFLYIILVNTCELLEFCVVFRCEAYMEEGVVERVIHFVYHYTCCFPLYILCMNFCVACRYEAFMEEGVAERNAAEINHQVHTKGVLFITIHFVYHYTSYLSLYILFIIIHFVNDFLGGGT
jgi:hypothetical protein